MPQRMFVILNPAAGRGRAVRAWRTVGSALRDAGLSFDEVVEDRPQLAIPLAEEASRRGYEVIVAVGGDGTVHEVINGILRARVPSPPAVAIIPGGTGNDFARGVGVPKDPLAAGRVLLNGRRRRVDVGQVNDRYFAGIAGVGFDAEVAAKVNSWPKWIGGTAVYIAAILTMLVTYRCAPTRLRIDGAEQRLRLFLVAAANTAWYAGGMYMAPHARPDDGRLEVITARDLGRMETLGLLPRVFSGAHLRHRKVTHLSAREVVVESEVPLAIHADGETVGRVPAVFRAVPQAIDVMVPAAAQAAASPRSHP
ncbi:MAG: diacylglycerol kinase family lipid kinase [Armatimonadota bacterium]|nr:diacylglycerol kinase family lipid kinase [Armatimonadota bacterium]MDR7450345.1 diacylglycerol kinase family lipid kinase [Armatimonadota bacterium]MDR7467072.1 diacylglycerol kinase family lipid kinase [Armatimonadota bacterium]MDR7493386.1 diacylglycerol kinase family lipid kinase [Armatimonadota bacterium]MDR7499394.1 diacylglycerol kinase family lipid kinase [Armatimonadota bacterium]